MEQKKQYVAPAITVVSFKAERGYAQSSLSNIPEIVNEQLDQFLAEQQLMMFESGTSTEAVDAQDNDLNAGFFSYGDSQSGFQWF